MPLYRDHLITSDGDLRIRPPRAHGFLAGATSTDLVEIVLNGEHTALDRDEVDRLIDALDEARS